MTSRTMGPSVRVPVREEPDVAIARLAARDLALEAGFPPPRAAALATAVSEVARNIIVHAPPGEIHLDLLPEGSRRGIIVVARDDGPGIADVAAALEDGYSTSLGLGLGLSSARRLVDEFTLESAVGEGTTVTMRKWAHAVP